MTSYFVRDLESVDNLCINPIRRIGLIRSDISIRVSSSGVYKLLFYFTIVNKNDVAVTLAWQDSTIGAGL